MKTIRKDKKNVQKEGYRQYSYWFKYNKDDKVKQAFKAIHIKNSLGAYIDIGLITKEIEEAEIKVKTDENPATEDGEASGEESNGYGF